MSIPAKTIQDIETLRKRHTELDRKRFAAEANLKTATGNLDALMRESRELYGTDNLEELRAKLEEMKKENDRKRAEYQTHLDGIETSLNDLEKQYAQSRSDVAR